MAPLPIKFTEILQLSAAGIQQPAIGFNSCTLESDHFVCVRQKIDDNAQPEVIIIDISKPSPLSHVTRRPIKADSAIMHYSREIIALKAAGKTLQIFDLG
ncbi:Clathrin heavy chain, partial [Teratosphaeriaceae sp. CCFEE 6253]